MPGTVPLGSVHNITLRAIGDGAVYAEVNVRLYAHPGCTPPPTVEQSGKPVIAVMPSYRDFPGTFDGYGYHRRVGPASGRANTASVMQNVDGGRMLNSRVFLFRQESPYLRLTDYRGTDADPVEVFSIPPGSAFNLYTPRLSLPFGFYTAVMFDDRELQLAAVARTDWTETGAAALVSNFAPSYELVLPVVVRNYYYQSSIISVMSDGNGRPVTVELSIYPNRASTPTSKIEFVLQPYEGVTFDLLDHHPAFKALGDGFLGSARLRLVYGPGRTDTGAQIGAIAHVNIARSQRAVWGYEAIPIGTDNDQSSHTLFAPLFRSRQRGANPGDMLDTGMAVVNPHDRSVEATVDFYPTRDSTASAACRHGGRFTTGPVTLPPRGSHVSYQGPGGGSYPDNCFGSAVIRSTDAGDTLLAIVNDAQNLDQYSAAYNAVPSHRAHTKIAAPLVRKTHGVHQLTTGIQVMNSGERDAVVHIDFVEGFGPGAIPIPGCGSDCDAVVPPMGSYTWWPPHIAALHDGMVGSAVIESSEPAVVIVNDYPLAGGLDAATYNGIPVFDEPAPRGRTGPRWQVGEVAQ